MSWCEAHIVAKRPGSRRRPGHPVAAEFSENANSF